MSKVHLTATINGEAREVLCEPYQTLLEVLRDELKLTGTKEGCSNGNCGACNVILNGSLVNSCLVLGAEAQGGTIETIEGLRESDSLHPIQQAFLENAALQCGICTPGMILAAVHLLNKTPEPTTEEIQEGLSGNLCRCTGYSQIVEAVAQAARRRTTE